MIRSINIVLTLVMASSTCCHTSPLQESSAYEMTADEIDCNQETGKCIAKNNARIITGKGDQAKTLTAQAMTAKAKEQGITTSQMIGAEGDVFLEAQGGKIQSIRSDSASYEPDSQKAKFDGNVQVRFGSHVFKGGHAIAELKQGDFVLKRGSQIPVTGLIYPDAFSENRHRR